MVFHCYYPTIWGRFTSTDPRCEELKTISSKMIDDMFSRLDGGIEVVQEDILELSFEEHLNPGPLTFLRGLASFLTRAFSPIAISPGEGR
jgi:hypothetical protein